MKVHANGLQIEVQVDGPSDGRPLLLVMGLGMQLIDWGEGFVSTLVERGFRVIRFDNRDIGLSDGFAHAGVPNLMIESLRLLLRLPVRAPYRLEDMARDALGVLDALGVEQADVCGVSMGGMIAQELAFIAPKRISSLTLVMTSSGERRLPGPTARVRRLMLKPPPRPGTPEVVERRVTLFRALQGPKLRTPDEEIRARALRASQRAFRPDGTARQLLAIAASPPRGRRLGRLTLPVAVVHGNGDPLVPVACGRDLAQRIPGARWIEIDGLGHDLPSSANGLLVEAIEGVSRAALQNGGLASAQRPDDPVHAPARAS